MKKRRWWRRRRRTGRGWTEGDFVLKAALLLILLYTHTLFSHYFLPLVTFMHIVPRANICNTI